MPEPRIAAAYVRVSTDDQMELSPDSQMEKIREYAAKNGLQSVRRRGGMLDPEVFVDRDAEHFTDRAKRGERRIRRFAAEILPDGVLRQAGSFGQLLVGDTRICRIFLVTA